MLINLFPLGWQQYVYGGLLIGAGIALLFVTTGWIGGVSSVFSSSWSWLSRAPYFQQAHLVSSRDWRLLYVAGLIMGALIWWLTLGPYLPLATSITWWQLLIGGFLVGFGARLARGCTSGHGICGLGSLQLPSLIAVVIFIFSGVLTAKVVAFIGARL